MFCVGTDKSMIFPVQWLGDGHNNISQSLVSDGNISLFLLSENHDRGYPQFFCNAYACNKD